MESVQNLFSKFPVGEIRELESKTRSEIETKKEDLRQMVGERYRDLIEAADTIAEMKKCATDVKESVLRMQRYTSVELRSGTFLQGHAKTKSSTVTRYMQLSAQVKLLMEMSETIWSHVEGGNMIEATHLYMQSRQVLKNLNLDGSTTYCPILQWFPVLGQQAQALDNLRSTILTECRRQLQDSNLNSKPLSEALCSIILLENSDITEAFPEFMEARFSAIDSKFEGVFGDTVDETGSSRLCKVVTLLAATVKQVHQLFVAPVKISEGETSSYSRKKSMLAQHKEPTPCNGLVSHVLNESHRTFTQRSAEYEKSDLIREDRLWRRHLPESVSKLTTTPKGDLNTTIPATQVQSTCQKWLEKCKASIQKGTVKLLSFITTFKGLSSLRQSLCDTLNRVSDVNDPQQSKKEGWGSLSLESGNSETSEWQNACQAVLGHQLLLWNEILRDLFLDKVKDLSQNLFADLLKGGKEKLECVLERVSNSGQKTDEDSTSHFIWHELPNDISPDTAWKQASMRKGQGVKDGLGLKALSVTPTLHGICVQLNASMKDVLRDLYNYIPEYRIDENRPSVHFTENSHSATLRSSQDGNEKSAICSEFRNSCAKCLRDILNVLSGYEASLLERMSKERSSMEEILFLAMFCRSFCQLCKEFETGCTVGEEPAQMLKKQLSNPSGSMSSSMMSQSLRQPKTSLVWEDINSRMSKQSSKFLKLWLEATITKAIGVFRSETLSLKDALRLFESIPAWDNIAIQEESETGSKVESEIKLPMTVSWPVLQLLYDICDNISNVGGHSMSRSTLQSITCTCLNGVLTTYAELKTMVREEQDTAVITDISGACPFTPTQTWALQKLFDLRTLHGLLYSSLERADESSDGEQMFEVSSDCYPELVGWLESHIDPFDLDVFAPHLTKNIQRCVQCSAVMLGFMIPPDKSESLHSTQPLSKSSGNSHNILPLTTDCGRFSYLPISNKMSKPDTVSLPASIKNHLPLSQALKQITDADKQKLSDGRKQSLYSKLGALSTSWLSMATSDN